MSLNILIIDDDADFRKILKKRFRSFLSDSTVTELADLKQTRSFLDSTQGWFDLVVLDEHLPDGRGVELLSEGWFEDLAVLCVSSDDAPHIPGATLRAGAAYFLSKTEIGAPLFQPLVEGIVERNVLQQQLNRSKLENAALAAIKTLVATLRHEIKNPLGAVLGAAFLLRHDSLEPEVRRAADLVERSGQRINQVLDQLCRAAKVEKVNKGRQDVFQIPGDKSWKE